MASVHYCAFFVVPDYFLVTESRLCKQLVEGRTRQRSWWDSNPRPLDHESDALPLHHTPTYGNRKFCTNNAIAAPSKTVLFVYIDKLVWAAVHQLHKWEASAAVQPHHVRAGARRVSARNDRLDVYRLRSRSTANDRPYRKGTVCYFSFNFM